MKMSCDFLRRDLHGKTLCCFFALSLLLPLADTRAASTPPGPPASPEESGAVSIAAILEAQNFPAPTDTTPLPPEITRKQRKDIQKMRFEKMKKDVGELATLADSLKDDVDKSSENILSLEIVEKAEKIEKLAKRIKNAAKGD
jgi:cell envelope opacity-associated protein A